MTARASMSDLSATPFRESRPLSAGSLTVAIAETLCRSGLKVWLLTSGRPSPKLISSA
jgi:hypothetical protein